jgi:hypothetical protein
MLAKLLSLLFHAKAGLVSSVLLLGATGALVSVSASNGVTTITITQPSASPSSAVTTVTTTRSPKPSESPEPSESPKLSSSISSACSDATKALSLQVQRVDSAFSGFHVDLMHLRGTRSVVVIETADVMLKNVRQAAVKALHATLSTTCTKTDDEDKAENDDEDNSTAAPATTSLNTDREKDEDSDGAKNATTPITFTGTDATGIADQAIAAMQAAFDTAKGAAASTAKPSHSPEPSRSPRVPQSSHNPEPKGDHD